MKLSIKAKEALKSREGVRVRNIIALALNKSVATVQRWIESDDDNLTKVVVLDIIKKETGLTEDQILEGRALSENLMGEQK